MKKNIAFAAAMTCGLLAFSSAQAQTTVFSDNFTSDSSLAQPPWYNLNNTSAASYALNPAAGQGLALTVSSGTGKLNEMFAEFTPVALNNGDYITLTVNFNSSGGMNTDTGGLLAGLYDNATVNSVNEQGSSGSTGTGGETAASQGYFGLMGYGTQAGNSSKFYSRQGGASDENELGYYSSQTSGSYTQIGNFAASGNADLALNTGYTLQFTITDNGASGNTILATVSQGTTPLDSWSSIDASGLYDTINQLDFGSYGKSTQVDINMLSASIVTDGVVVAPEPSVVAMAGTALGLLGVMRFRRRLK